LRLREVKVGRNFGLVIVDALYIAVVVSGTAILSVGIGVFGAYWAISGLLAAVNPSRPVASLSALVPNQGQVSGD
jgi:hypothetical protein